MLFKPTAAILLLVFAFANSGFSQPEIEAPPADSLAKPIEKLNNSTQFGKEGIGMGSRITGTSKLNISFYPLLVVNGIPYHNILSARIDFTTADERDYAELLGIAQEDIKEIAVLNDATSAAQYGTQAANGVILITTYRAANKKIRVDYTYRNTLKYNAKGYDMLNGDDYTMMMKQALFNVRGNAMDADFNELNYDASWEFYNYYNKNIDWFNEISKTGNNQEHFLALSGSTGKLGYRISGNHQNQQGMVTSIGQKRDALRVSLDAQIIKNLSASYDLDYSYTNNFKPFQGVDDYSIQELALKKMPNMTIYKPDSEGNITNEYYCPANSLQNYYNPVALVNLSSDKQKTDRISHTFSVRYNPIKNLKYLFSIYYLSDNYKNNIDASVIIFGGGTSVKQYSENEKKFLYTKNQLDYTFQLNTNHLITTTASVSTLNKRYLSQSNNNTNKNYNASLCINYSAYNRYTIDFCGNREQSKDAYNAKASTFDPSASLLWYASREKFMKSLGFIDNLSFNASYGIFNNNNSIRNSIFNGSSKYSQLNYGTHLVLLKNRVDVSLNFFDIDIEDEMKTIENKGWEFNFRTELIRSKNFSVELMVNLHNYFITYTKVSPNVFLTEGSSTANGSYVKVIEIDKSVGEYYGYKFKGVYKDSIATRAKDAAGNEIYSSPGSPVKMRFGYPDINYTFQPGDASYADLNYDGNINETDLSVVANVNPLFSGSGGTSFRYRNWWLGVYFNFRYGNDIINMARMSLENVYTFDNQSSELNYRWRKPGDQTNIPRALYKSGYNWLGSDRFVEDGSFIRLKAITLKYNFGEPVLKKLRLSNLSVLVTCRNLFTLTNYKGADPDIYHHYNSWLEEKGKDNNYTPLTREFTFSICVGI